MHTGTSSRSTKLIHGGVRYLEKVRASSSARRSLLPGATVTFSRATSLTRA